MHSVLSSNTLEETFERLLAERQARMSTDTALLRRAFADAQELYGEQMHWTGETLIEDCIGVLKTYLPFEPDDEGVIVCLLHHSLDTKRWTLDDLERHYGTTVRSIISSVHLLSHVTMKNRRTSLGNLRMMFLRVSDDIRVVLLILCDHSHKLDRLKLMSPEIRTQICRDVLHLFAPVAARLGIYSLKHQLETSAFPIAYPTDAARIDEQLEQLHQKHGHFLDTAATTMTKFLADAGVHAKVEGREKQTYSIFQKMRSKSITHVEDIYDLFAFRVIVDTPEACYQTLGLLHRIGHPVVNRFKDYIAFPKPNGYQSLHTTLARLPGVPEGIFIEVQIRTESMHREADMGIAAHWTYKEGATAEHATRRAQLQRALTLQQPLEERPDSSALSDHIFALTPKGDIVELPEGATPLDFAFQVHTALGLSFRSARVNGSIVPLTYQLENGDIVEIMKHRDPHPSPNWLQMLKTASAKSRLKRYLSTQERPSYIQIGRESLNQELQHYHFPQLDSDLTVLRKFDGKPQTHAEREDILMKIGQGSQNAASLLPHLDALQEELRQRIAQPKQRIPPPTVHAIPKVSGNIPMPVRFALCCTPDEEHRSPIAGVIGRDGSVRVHRAECKMLKTVNPERRIDVMWVVQK